MMKKKVDIVNKIPEALSDQVFESLHALVHRLRAQRFRQLRESGLELAHMEAKALGFFARHPLATQGDLVSHAGRDKAQIARLIAALKDKGLLEAHENAEDKRSVRLALTPTGENIWQAMKAEARRMQTQAVAALNADECRQLVDMLERVSIQLPSDEDAGLRKSRRGN